MWTDRNNDMQAVDSTISYNYACDVDSNPWLTKRQARHCTHGSQLPNILVIVITVTEAMSYCIPPLNTRMSWWYSPVTWLHTAQNAREPHDGYSAIPAHLPEWPNVLPGTVIYFLMWSWKFMKYCNTSPTTFDIFIVSICVCNLFSNSATPHLTTEIIESYNQVSKWINL